MRLKKIWILSLLSLLVATHIGHYIAVTDGPVSKNRLGSLGDG